MTHLFSSRDHATRDAIGTARPRRSRPGRRHIDWEPLEVRTLLATLNIAGGALSFLSTPGVADNLTILTSGPTGKYTFTDLTTPATTITLQAGAIAAGWTGSGTNTVTGPDRSVTSIAVDTRDGNDTVAVQSADASVALTFTNLAGNVDTVTIGGDAKKGTQSINGSVSINNISGTTDLIVDDTHNATKPVTVSMSSTKITGLLPGAADQDQPNAIDYSKTSLGSFIYDEGGAGTTLSISSIPKSTQQPTINTGQGQSVVNVTTVQAISGPLTIDARGTDTVTLGTSPYGVQNIAGTVTLETSAGGSIATLNVDDSADTVGRPATISSTTITGLAPATIDYSAAAIANLNVKGGPGRQHVHVASLPDAIVTLNTGASADDQSQQPQSQYGQRPGHVRHREPGHADRQRPGP